MKRFQTLLLFELRKVLAGKKALMFMLVMNVVPILAGILSLVLYLKFKGWGMGSAVKFSMLVHMIRGIFTAHIKLFAWFSPFFLALVVGDSFSGESGRGYMKTLLLTPVSRRQVIAAKALAVMCFLIAAVAFGGFFLQLDLWAARAMTATSGLLMDMPEVPASLITTSSAMTILLMMVVANIAMLGYLILFSLFFESVILMIFVSLAVLMTMQTYVMMVPFLVKIEPNYGMIEKICFTRHLSKLFEIDIVRKVLEEGMTLTSPAIMEPLTAAVLWGCFFFFLAAVVFSRKQILN